MRFRSAGFLCMLLIPLLSAAGTASAAPPSHEENAMTSPQPDTGPVPNFRVDRHARNEIDFHNLLRDATSGDTSKTQPAAGTSYQDGVAATLRWMSGGKHPFVQPTPDPRAALPQAQQNTAEQPAQGTPQPPVPNRGPTGAGAAPTGAGGGGTGTTGTTGTATAGGTAPAGT